MINTLNNGERTAAESAVGFVLALTSGFILSETQLAGVASFTDISLAGALSLPYSAAVLTGSLVHSILGENVGRNIVKISAMLMILITKLFFDTKKEPRFCGITTAVSIFISGAAVSALIGEVVYKLLFYAFYGSLSGLTTYSAVVIMESLRNRTVIDLSSSRGSAYAVVYTIIVAALCSVKVPIVNAGLLIGIIVTITGAYYYGQTGGVLCAALTACGAFLASPDYGMSVVLLPVAGMLTGYFNKRGSMMSAFVFSGSEFVLMVITGVTNQSINVMVNVIAASVIFAAAAPLYSDKWVKRPDCDSAALPELMHTRMSFMSDSIGTVREESEKISQLLAKNADHCNAAESITEKICAGCFKRLSCLKTHNALTLSVLRRFSESAEYSEENFPHELDECLHKSEICTALDERMRERITARMLETRFHENRLLMFEQLRIMEEMIAYASKRIDVRYSEKTSSAVSAKLRKFGVGHNNVIAYYNDRDRLIIELYFAYKDSQQNFMRVCDLISDELRIPLNVSEPVNSGKEIRVRIYEKPKYDLDVYCTSRSADKNGDNGDSTVFFSDGTGLVYAVLSDGMGSGRKAAVESKIVVKMFRKLVSSGVNYNSAIGMINSIMVTKSQDESFATLDAVKVDLDTCGLTVIKSGAASTLIRHRNSVIKISSPTFPIGIYEQSEVFSREYDFEEGDILIMCSDGISENEYLYIKELLMSESDLKKIVDDICAKSDTFTTASRADDVTVIGMRVKMN